jgi:hypothetical protein
MTLDDAGLRASGGGGRGQGARSMGGAREEAGGWMLCRVFLLLQSTKLLAPLKFMFS